MKVVTVAHLSGCLLKVKERSENKYLGCHSSVGKNVNVLPLQASMRWILDIFLL